ncbi:MAG: DUF72 domain-containing protein [Candidatus Thorarchaeota archaeon]
MSRMREGLHFGTCGWSYIGPEEYEWIDVFYTTKSGLLRQYFAYFDMVEINTTFYGPAKPNFVEHLVNEVDDEKFFTAKIPHQITHVHRLDLKTEAGIILEEFFDSVRPLGEKLQVLLVQLPPWPLDSMSDLEEFLANLDNSFRFAIEFRHQSWISDSVQRLLERYDVCNVIVDEPGLPINLGLTSDFAYIRWHGHGTDIWYNYLYSLDELQHWKTRLGNLLDQTKTVFCLFNNHFYANSIVNAFQMMELMDEITPSQKAKLERMNAQRAIRQTSIEDF